MIPAFVRAHELSRHFATLLLSLVTAGVCASSAHAATSLSLRGEPGSAIAPGQTYEYTEEQGTFSAQANYEQGVSASFTNYPNYWYLDFAGPGNTPLQVGLYQGAQRFPVYEGNAPGISVYGSGGTCYEVTGAFRVKQITYTGPTVTSFWVEFEQRCNGYPGAVFGEFRYNANVDVAVSAPFSRSVARRDSVTFPVTATGVSPDPIEIRAENLPSGATFTYAHDRGGVFEWVPGASQFGRHRVTFVAEDAEGRTDSTTTAINVTGVTSLTVISESGDFVGQGSTYVFTDSGAYSAVRNNANGVSITYGQGNNYSTTWNLDFAAPLSEPLQPGEYLDAIAYGQNTAYPGMRVTVANRYCNTITGTFHVKQVAYGPSGSIEAFWARFEQHCNGESAGLSGEIRFNAAVIVEIQSPATQVVERGHPLAFQIRAADIDSRSLTLSATGLPAGASFVDGGSGSGALQWTPGTDQVGLYPVTFHARNAQGDEDSVVTRIRVTGVTSLTLVSESGEPMGSGQTFSYVPANASFTATRADSGVSINVTGDGGGYGDRWNIGLSPRTGQPLRPGYYPNAQKYASASQPGLGVYRLYNDCNTVIGGFQIKQIVLGSGNTVESLWATFEQHCNGASPALRGEIRYNADVRVVVSAPTSRSVVREETVEFVVSATDLVPGPIALSATQLPSGASFVDHGDRTGTFAFTPTIAQSGSHFVVFHGRNSAGLEDSTVTEIRVTGLTSLAIESEPGDPVGFGDSYFYPSTAGSFNVSRNTYDRSINLVFSEGRYGEQWNVSFIPPTNTDLYGAAFDDVRRQADATHPGFSITRNSYYSSCGDLEGQFQILQLDYGVGPQIEAFWATFDVRCSGNGGWIHGEVRVNADVRLVIASPAIFEADRGQPLSIGVSGTELSGRPVALSAFALPPGAVFQDLGDDTGVLTWTPGWDQFGEFVVGFLGDDAEGGLSTARTRINVRGVSSLVMHSDAADSVGDGEDYTFDRSNALFVGGISSRNHSMVTVDQAMPDDWLLGFAASDTGQLRVGTYRRATAVPAPNRASLIVSPRGYYYGYPYDLYTPCSTLDGAFRVKQVSYAADGRLRSLWVLFEQHCNESSAALTGELRFNADVVVAIHAPSRAEVDPAAPLSVEVRSEHLAGGAAVLTARGLPQGAQFVDHGNNSGTLTWTPASNQRGIHPITFLATGLGRTDSTVCDVRVRGINQLSIRSETGDPVGGGASYDMNAGDGEFVATHNAVNGVSLRFRSGDGAHDFEFDFAAPGNLPLAPLTYSPAGRYPFQERTRPGIDVTLDGLSCNTLLGTFTVHEISYGLHDEIEAFHASFVQRCNGAGPGLSGDILFNAGSPTPVQAAFVSAEIGTGFARIIWDIEDHDVQVRIERQVRDEPWTAVTQASPDGSGRVAYEDHDVHPGDRIGYRIGIEAAGEMLYYGQQWIDIPITRVLALGRAWPNPTTDAVHISLALPDRSPATLELVDIAGRRIASVDAGALGPGEHDITIEESRRLPPGIYTVRLISNGRSLNTPVCVVR